MSRRNFPDILGMGWGFPGTGSLPTFWPFVVIFGTIMAWVCTLSIYWGSRSKWKLSLPSWTQLVLISFVCPWTMPVFAGCALPFSVPVRPSCEIQVKEVQEGLQGSQMHTTLKEWELSNPGLKNLRFGFGPWLVLYELILTLPKSPCKLHNAVH